MYHIAMGALLHSSYGITIQWLCYIYNKSIAILFIFGDLAVRARRFVSV
jgi:hypothetical protein